MIILEEQQQYGVFVRYGYKGVEIMVFDSEDAALGLLDAYKDYMDNYPNWMDDYYPMKLYGGNMDKTHPEVMKHFVGEVSKDNADQYIILNELDRGDWFTSDMPFVDFAKDFEDRKRRTEKDYAALKDDFVD